MGDMTIDQLVSEAELERLRLRARDKGETLEAYLSDVLRGAAGPDEEQRRRQRSKALTKLDAIRARSKPMTQEEADRFFQELKDEREARTDRILGLAD